MRPGTACIDNIGVTALRSLARLNLRNCGLRSVGLLLSQRWLSYGGVYRLVERKAATSLSDRAILASFLKVNAKCNPLIPRESSQALKKKKVPWS